MPPRFDLPPALLTMLVDPRPPSGVGPRRNLANTPTVPLDQALAYVVLDEHGRDITQRVIETAEVPTLVTIIEAPRKREEMPWEHLNYWLNKPPTLTFARVNPSRWEAEQAWLAPETLRGLLTEQERRDSLPAFDHAASYEPVRDEAAIAHRKATKVERKKKRSKRRAKGRR